MANKNSADLVARFETMLTNEGKSPKTLESYLNDVRGFLDFLEAKGVRFNGVMKRFHISSYRQHLLDNSFKTNTINKKINSLQSFNHFLINEKLTEELVVHFRHDTIKVAGGSEIEVEVFTEQEAEKILFFVNEERGINALRNKAVVYTLLYTGIRVSELVNIRQQDMDLLAMQLTVLGKGEKQREIPLKEEVVHAIKEYLSNERKESKFAKSRYVFVTQRAGKMDRDCVNKFLKRMGRELNLQVNPHKFRHTFCTRLLKKGVDLTTVSKLAGHAGIQTTAKFYINTSRADKQSAVSVL